GIFLLIWIVSTFLVGTGAKYLSLPGIVLGALLFFALLGACCFVGNKFIKDHDRLPTAPERKRLFWYSFILPALFNILGIVAIYMADLPETEALRNAPVILNAATTIVTF